MLYQKLFELSGLTEAEIKKRLGLTKQQLGQFSESKSINPERFFRFSILLGIPDKDATELVINEISKLWKRES